MDATPLIVVGVLGTTAIAGGVGLFIWRHRAAEAEAARHLGRCALLGLQPVSGDDSWAVGTRSGFSIALGRNPPAGHSGPGPWVVVGVDDPRWTPPDFATEVQLASAPLLRRALPHEVRGAWAEQLGPDVSDAEVVRALDRLVKAAREALERAGGSAEH